MELLCCSVYSTVSCLLQEAGRCKREQGAVRCSAVASMSWDMRNASDSNASKASTCSMHGGQAGRRADGRAIQTKKLRGIESSRGVGLAGSARTDRLARHSMHGGCRDSDKSERWAALRCRMRDALQLDENGTQTRLDWAVCLDLT